MYAPDLNLQEMVWSYTKEGDLANFILDDLRRLHQSLAASLERTRSQLWLPRSFFGRIGCRYERFFIRTRFASTLYQRPLRVY